MITEPLTSELQLTQDGVWAASIIDSLGHLPGREINVQEWGREMGAAVSLLVHLNRPGTLIIVHPDGYGRR